MTVQARASEALDRAFRIAQEVSQRLDVAQAVQGLFYWSGQTLVDLYVRLALEMDVLRLAPLPAGPKIIAANHPTTTDPFYMLAVIPEQTSILITDMAFGVPGFGAYLRTAGHVPVIKGRGQLAFEQARQRLVSGGTIGIFPEGALSPLGDELGFHPARTGVARLALCTGAPIVPVGISLDTRRIRFQKTTVGEQSEIARWYLGGPYAVTVGAAMYCEGDIEDWEGVRSISRRVLQRIAWLSHASARRLERSYQEAATAPRSFQSPEIVNGV